MARTKVTAFLAPTKTTKKTTEMSKEEEKKLKEENTEGVLLYGVTIPKLKEKLKAEGIPFKNNMRKAELVALLGGVMEPTIAKKGKEEKEEKKEVEKTKVEKTKVEKKKKTKKTKKVELSPKEGKKEKSPKKLPTLPMELLEHHIIPAADESTLRTMKTVSKGTKEMVEKHLPIYVSIKFGRFDGIPLGTFWSKKHAIAACINDMQNIILNTHNFLEDEEEYIKNLEDFKEKRKEIEKKLDTFESVGENDYYQIFEQHIQP